MGIPFYFGTLLRKHRTSILLDKYKGCEYLCFDFNCLIHRCAAEVASTGRFDGAEELQAEALRAINHFAAKLIEIMRPTKGVYIAVDGVPPLAKIQQQRRRRYMSLYEKKFKGGSSSSCPAAAPTLWNSNVVTPGTAFMEALSSSLAGFFASFAGSPVVTVSDWKEPGEGEHKIFHYLAGAASAAGGSASKKKPSVVIYGLDADMIMLSLLRPEYEIVLAREKEGVSLSAPQIRHFNVVDVQHLRRLLVARLGGTCPSAGQGLVNDYVTLCMLVGNDFLPPLSSLSILNHDIDYLVDAYVAAKADPAERLLASFCAPPEVNYGLLARILRRLAEDEDAMMKRATDEYYEKRPPPPSAGVEAAWKSYPLLYKFPKGAITPDKNTGWRPQYYAQLFGPDCEPAAVVEAYIEGIEWNLAYYGGNAAPDEQWHYPYPYSPTAKDLYNRVAAKGGPVEGWRQKHRGKPVITPAVQLLAVIPPDDAALLPERYRRVHDDLALGCTHFYPATFRILTYLKHFAWEMVPLLPVVDVADVAAAVQKMDRR